MRKPQLVRVASPRGLRLLSLALVLGGSACRYESPQERGILALMESPGKHIESRRCVPAGQRNLRAGLRRPVVCVAQYAEGTAMWHRDVWGAVQTALRTWRLSPEDSARLPQLRDSVAALVARIAGGGPCASRAVFDGEGWLSAWNGRRYALTVLSLEHSRAGPGGNELRFEVAREDTLCPRAQLWRPFRALPATEAQARGNVSR